MSVFGGFDTGSYPGDDAVTKWARGGSPFQFIGFYLQAPCHTKQSFTPFQGKFSLLKSLGWGLVIVYVGRQVKGCGSKSLKRSVGDADGLDAVTKSKAEGFTQGSIVYLDVEPFDGKLPAGMQDYVAGWIDALLLDRGFEPGIYCHAKNAIDLHTLGEERYVAAGRPAGAPPFWITRVRPTFDVATSVPADSGISFADVWQGQIDIVGVQHSGVKLAKVDLNVALSANPSKA